MDKAYSSIVLLVLGINSDFLKVTIFSHKGIFSWRDQEGPEKVSQSAYFTLNRKLSLDTQ